MPLGVPHQEGGDADGVAGPGQGHEAACAQVLGHGHAGQGGDAEAHFHAALDGLDGLELQATARLGPRREDLPLEVIAVAAPQGLEQDCFAHQVLGRDARSFGEAVGRGTQNQDLLVPQLLHRQGLGGEGLFQHDGAVDGAFQHHALEVPGVARNELHADLGELGVEGLEHRRQQVGADGLRRCEAHGAHLRLAFGGGHGFFGKGQDALRIDQEAMPRLRQLQVVPHAVEERVAQQLLQRLHLGGDARLGIAEGGGGLGEAQGAGRRAESEEGPSVHRAPIENLDI